MKTTTALITASLLSASLPAFAQGVVQQGRPGAAALPPQINSQQMYQGTGPQPGTMSQTVVPQRPGVAPGTQPLIGNVPPLPANLQNPMVAGQTITDIFSMMQMLEKLAQDQRRAARESRSTDREAQLAALESAADKMKQAAAAALAQAQVNGAMAIATGAMSPASGAISITPGMTAQKNLSAPGKGVATTDPKAQAAAGEKLQAPTKALAPQDKQQAIGSIIGAQQAFSASMAAADADSKKAEAAKMVAQNNAQSQQQAQMMQQMQAVLADVQQKLQAIMQAQNSTSQMLARP